MSTSALSSILEHGDDFESLHSDVKDASEALLLNNDGIALDKEGLAKIVTLHGAFAKKKQEITKREAEYAKPGAKIKSAKRAKKQLQDQQARISAEITTIDTTDIPDKETEITTIQTTSIDPLQAEITTLQGRLDALEDDSDDIKLLIVNKNADYAVETNPARRKDIKDDIKILKDQLNIVKNDIGKYDRKISAKKREIKEYTIEQNTLRKEISILKKDKAQKDQKIFELDNKIYDQDDKVIELEQQKKEAQGEYTNLGKRTAAIKRIDQEKKHYGKIIQLGSQMRLDNATIEKTPDEMGKSGMLRRGSLEVKTSGDFFKGAAPDGTSFSLSGEKGAKVSIDERTGEVSIYGLKKNKLPPEITFKVKATVPVPPEVNGQVPKATHSKTYTVKTSALQAAYASEGGKTSLGMSIAKKAGKGMGGLTRGVGRTLTGLLGVSLVGKPSLISTGLVNGGSTALEYVVKKPIDKMMDLHKSEQGWMYAPNMAAKVPLYAAKYIALAPFKALRSRGKGYTGYWKDSVSLAPDLIAGNIGAKEAIVKNLHALKNNHKIADFTPKAVDSFLKAV